MVNPLIQGLDSSTRLTMLTGGPGTGKSHIIKEFKEFKKVKVTAPTGLSAYNIGGKTLNSTLGVYQLKELNSKKNNGQLTQTLLALLIDGYEYLLIDEAFMVDAETIDNIIYSLKECNQLRGKRSQLGLILVGDPAQIPPVKGRPTYESKFFNEFRVHKLTTNHRQKEDPQWVEALQLARKGNIISFANACHDLGLFRPKIDLAFEGLTIIPTNKSCISFNKANTAIHRDKPKKFDGLKGSLYLAKGSPLFIKSNFFQKGERVFNGQLASVIDLPEGDDDSLLVQIEDGKRVELPINPVPAIMGPAGTAHGAQGRTLDSIQVVLQECFKLFPGGLYVALTRTRGSKGTSIIGNRKSLIDCFTYDKKALQLGLV